jgi:hypothetical protein
MAYSPESAYGYVIYICSIYYSSVWLTRQATAARCAARLGGRVFARMRTAVRPGARHEGNLTQV